MSVIMAVHACVSGGSTAGPRDTEALALPDAVPTSSTADFVAVAVDVGSASGDVVRVRLALGLAEESTSKE